MRFKNNLLARNLVTLVIGETLSRVIYAIAFIHIARVLEPHIYGQLELSLAIILTLTIVVDLGLGVIGTREIAHERERSAVLVREIISMQLGLAIIIFTALVAIVSFLPLEGTLKILLIGYGISLFGYPFNLNWVFQGWNQMIWVSVPQVIRQSVFAISTLIILRSAEQVYIIPAIELVSVSVAVALNVWLYTRTNRNLVLDLFKSWRSGLHKLSIPVGGSQLIWALRMYFPTILLAALAGQTAVGFYGAPQRVVMVLQGLLMVYFVNLLPNLSQAAFTSMHNFTSMLTRSLRLLVWPSLFMAGLVSFFAPRIIEQIYGVQYLVGNSQTIMAVLVWLFPILVWRGHGRNALIVINKQKDELICSGSGLALLFCLLIPLTLRFGGVGVAFAVIFSEFFATLLNWWRLKIHLAGFHVFRVFTQFPSLSILYEIPNPR